MKAGKDMRKLLGEQLKDLYSAENQLVKALPRLGKKATHPNLVQAFQNHLRETERQVVRLQEIAEELDLKLTGKKCLAMEGLIEECKPLLRDEISGFDTDVQLIAAAQRVEHYEISAYGTAKAMAEQLNLGRVVDLLRESENEEINSDEKLTEIATADLYPALRDEQQDSVLANSTDFIAASVPVI